MLDVFQSARLLVDQVFTRTVTIDSTGDGDLMIIGAQFLLTIREGDGYFSQTERLARVGTVEDDVDELRTTKGRRTLFAQHPTDGVGNIGFSAAVRTHNGNQTRVEREPGLVGEALEADNV